MGKKGYVQTNDDGTADIADASQNTNAVTLQQMNSTMTNYRPFYRSGTLKTGVKEFITSGTCSSGSVTFYLTDNGASNGNAIFTNVYKESANFWIEDANNAYQFSSYSLSGDKKTLTLGITRLGTSAGTALLNLIGGTLSVLTGITFGNAATNGTTVYLAIKGD